MMTFPTNRTNETTKSFERCTLYFQGGYGVTKLEVRDARITIAPYAQWPEAVHVVFTEKGKRKARGFVQTFRPDLVVVEGWDQKAPENYAQDVDQGNGVVVRKGRFVSCADEWQGVLAEAIEGAKVLADYRRAA